MNCDDFREQWERLVANTIDDSNRGAMVAHARTCKECGDRLAIYDEVHLATQRVVESQPLPTGIAEEAANHAYQSKYAGVELNAPASTSSSESTKTIPMIGSISAQTIAWVLGALIVGFFLGGRGGGQATPNPMQQIQQLQNMQMIYGGGRGGNPYEAMMMSQMMAANAGGGLLPAFNPTIKVIFLAVALMWCTRSRLWKRLFPAKIPLGIKAARWMALIAALVGLARCIGYASMTGFTMTQGTQGGVFGGNGRDGVGWMFQSLQMVDQLWAITFWLTILILVMTVADLLVQALVPKDAPNRG